MQDQKQLILVADADERTSLVLREYLIALGYAVLWAYDGEEVLALYTANEAQIDLVLMDVHLPKMDGITVLKELHQIRRVPVIFQSETGDEYEQIRAFRAGADDFVAKPYSQSVLVLRMEAVLHRYVQTEARPLMAGGIEVNQVRRVAKLDGTKMELTRREFDLLAYFLSNQGGVLSRDILLSEVWGDGYGGDLRTVDTHVKQLRVKLGVYAAGLKTIFRVGYQFQL